MLVPPHFLVSTAFKKMRWKDEFRKWLPKLPVYFLIFDVHQAAVSLPFQVNRLQVLACRFLNACFGFADEGPEKAQNGSFSNLLKICASPLCVFLKVAVV